MKKIVLIFTLLLSASGATAQQEAMYTHYAFNTLAINPAYAGSRDALTLTALHRSQWVGFKGSPHTQTITAHAPIRSKDMGLGLSIMNDKIGPTNTTSFFADYSYKIPLHKGHLAMGAKAGFDLFQARLDQLSAMDDNDVTLNVNVRNEILPNFGFGAYYVERNYYVGISTPRMLRGRINTANGSSFARERHHYYLIGGAMLRLNQSLQFKPMGLLKVTKGAPLELDITGIMVIDERLEIGAMYRTGDACGALVGFNLKNNMRIGYSFDWSFGLATGQYNAGSHEIMLRYDFIKIENKQIVSPRHF